MWCRCLINGNLKKSVRKNDEKRPQNQLLFHHNRRKKRKHQLPHLLLVVSFILLSRSKRWRLSIRLTKIVKMVAPLQSAIMPPLGKPVKKLQNAPLVYPFLRCPRRRWIWRNGYSFGRRKWSKKRGTIKCWRRSSLTDWKECSVLWIKGRSSWQNMDRRGEVWSICSAMT